MNFRQRARTVIETRLPILAAVFRAVRDDLRTTRVRSVLTPYGFLLKGDLMMQDGSFEREEIAVIQRELQSVDAFVDVGANVGFYACLARHGGKRVLAIEPLPANLRLLFDNIRANGWTDVEVWPVATGAAPGILDLYGGATGASLESGWSGVSAAYRQPVAVTTLDAILGSRLHGTRTFIKVDIEGAEFALLHGASGIVLASPKPTWLVEITLTENRSVNNPRYADTFKWFWDHGYLAFTADSRRLQVHEADVRRWVSMGRCELGVYNFLFVPQENG